MARLAVDAGHDVVLSNSRGPETLAHLVAELGPGRGRLPGRKPPRPATLCWCASRSRVSVAACRFVGGEDRARYRQLLPDP